MSLDIFIKAVKGTVAALEAMSAAFDGAKNVVADMEAMQKAEEARCLRCKNRRQIIVRIPVPPEMKAGKGFPVPVMVKFGMREEVRPCPACTPAIAMADSVYRERDKT